MQSGHEGQILHMDQECNLHSPTIQVFSIPITSDIHIFVLLYFDYNTYIPLLSFTFNIQLQNKISPKMLVRNLNFKLLGFNTQ